MDECTPGEYKWLKTLVTPNGSPTPSSWLNSLAPIKWYATHQTVLYIAMLRISHRVCWKTLSWPHPDNEFRFFTCAMPCKCSSFQMPGVRLLVPSGTFGCFVNVTNRVRHTLYVLFHPQIRGYFLLPPICRHRIFLLILWNLVSDFFQFEIQIFCI